MDKTAYDAFIDIIDTNETIDGLKDMNYGNQPNKVLCNAIRLLVDYRSVLSELMMKTYLLGDSDNDNNRAKDKDSE